MIRSNSSIQTSFLYSVLLFIFLPLVFTNPGFAKPPGQTKPSKFRPWDTTFSVFSVPIGLQSTIRGTIISFNELDPKEGRALLKYGSKTYATFDFGRIKNQARLQGSYRSNDDTFKNALGASGTILLEPFAESPFSVISATFTPNDGFEAQTVDASKAIPKEFLNARFVNRVKVRGKRAPGGKIKIKAQTFNRGPSVTTSNQVSMAVAIAPAVSNINLGKEINATSSGCSATNGTEFSSVVCPIQYTGPKGNELKGQSKAEVNFTFTVPSDLAGETLNISVLSRPNRSDLEFVRKSKTKRLKIKIRDSGSSGGGNGGGSGGGSGLSDHPLVGKKYCSSLNIGPSTAMQVMFSASGSSITGVISKNPFVSLKSCGLEVGSTYYRNLTGGGLILSGEVIRCKSGSTSWEEIRFSSSSTQGSCQWKDVPAGF